MGKPNKDTSKKSTVCLNRRIAEEAVVGLEAAMNAFLDCSGTKKLKAEMLEYLKGGEAAMLPRIETVESIQSKTKRGFTPHIEISFTGKNGVVYNWEASPIVNEKTIEWTGSITPIQIPSNLLNNIRFE